MTVAYEAGGSTAGYPGNLKGAYTEYLASKGFRITERGGLLDDAEVRIKFSIPLLFL